MTDRGIDEQLTKYLSDVHSIEEQALAQLERPPAIADEPYLADVFRSALPPTGADPRPSRAPACASEA
jgi:hypothetical protein